MTIKPSCATYGSWVSPITANQLTTQTQRISEPQASGNTLYWLESRPEEQGRTALVRLYSEGNPEDVLPAPHSIRTRANEYGGGAYLVVDDNIFMVLDADQRVYHLNADSSTRTALSPPGNFRYADFCFDKVHRRLVCVREDHSVSDENIHTEARCELVALSIDGSAKITVLATGADFYSNPRLSPDNTYLSWLSWNHPQMPWDGTECYIAELDAEGTPLQPQLIVGHTAEAIVQPEWSPNGELVFVSDCNNWWNLYRWNPNTQEVRRLTNLVAEFARPRWVFGMSSFGFLDSNTLLCTYVQQGEWQLASVDLTTQKLTQIASDLTDISALFCQPERACFLAAHAKRNSELYCFQPSKSLSPSAVLPYNKSSISERYFSAPQAISFTTRDQETAHGFYYPPHNPDFYAPENRRPPLLVMCHGGPTAATESSLNMKIQYWTSRGFAVLDVNYRGSTGYGRAYRDRLHNNWGITDVIDMCSAVDYAIEQAWVDPEKIAIRGSSAGGYTVLAALTFSDTFKAGASLYGIGDLEALAQDTHKFEARYLDSLVGAYPAQQDRYRARSPIYHTEQLNCPVIFLQGLEDKVVPPNQAEAMVNALTQKGIANAHITFANEGHGFRQAENIERAITAELYFYSQIFQFEPADNLTPIVINNLSTGLPNLANVSAHPAPVQS